MLSDTGRRRSDVSICVLAGAPLARGGIERLTNEVTAALRGSLGNDAVALAGIHGPSDRSASIQPPTFLGGSRLSPWAKVRFGLWVVLRPARRRPGEFLVAMHVNLSQVAYAAHLAWGTPYAVWAHGAEVWSRLQPLPRTALRAANAVLCSSSYTRAAVIGQGVAADRAHVVNPSVSERCLAAARLGPVRAGDKGPVVLSVGRVARSAAYKGFDTVIDLLPDLSRRVPAVRYVVAGGGDDLPRLDARARDRGVRERVDLLGDVDDERLWRAYREARVLVMPSRAGDDDRSPRGEGFGITYVEAAAFGLPVIGSTVGGATDAVESGVTGELVDPTDRGALLGALERYLIDPVRATEAGESGRARILRDFTPEAFARRLNQAIAPLVSHVRSHRRMP